MAKKDSKLQKMTLNYWETIQNCDSSYVNYVPKKPKRVLTEPSKPCHNKGFDNENYDLILSANDFIQNPNTDYGYIVHEILGSGTFGQVSYLCLIKNRWPVLIGVTTISPMQ